MRSLSLPNTEIRSTKIVPADPAKGIPEYCSVIAMIHSTILFEARMPTTSWNGKLYFQGNSGFAGRVPHNPDGLPRNYATLATDTGHGKYEGDNFDASWALNNRHAEIDFGYRAVHETLVIGKKVIAAYYRTTPSRSYFDGCSQGGRQALEEAQRYPSDFDGIIAGSPVLDFTGVIIGYTWDMQANHATETSSDITLKKLALEGKAVLEACDGLDGLIDGLIDDPRKCRFNPATLQCSGADASNCLTAAQVDAFQKIYHGPVNSAGDRLFPGFERGGEKPDSSGNGWDFWVVFSANGTATQLVIADLFLRYLAFKVDDPNFDWRDFDFNTDPARMQFMGDILNATNVDLTNFKNIGGKLLMYQGWSDMSVAPRRTISYYQDLRKKFGNSETNQFARLFMAPGMYHCFGGPGPNDFDSLGALEQWVEHGHAPASIEATHFNDKTGKPDRTRPLCPYPQVARYNGSGSINNATNFHCE